jgi:hypothetical protein
MKENLKVNANKKKAETDVKNRKEDGVSGQSKNLNMKKIKTK